MHERGWILEQWFDHLAIQFADLSHVQIVLNYGASQDETLAIINDERERGRFGAITMLVDHGDDHRANRQWNETRYETMVRLRNDLLAWVRAKQPDFYLSCDTDMLLPPYAITTLVDEIGDYDAIGPLTHMTPTGICPNAFAMDGDRWRTSDQTEQVYAVFGTVLMRPTAYAQDYAVHRTGEDVGWAANCWKARLRMAIAPKVKVKHVMNLEMRDVVDQRVGF